MTDLFAVSDAFGNWFLADEVFACLAMESYLN